MDEVANDELNFFVSCRGISMPVQNAAQHMFRGAMSRISGTAQTPRVPYVQVEIVVYNGSQRPKVRQETIYTDTVRDKNPCFASSIELNYPKDSNRLIQFNISVRDEENRPSMLFGSCKLTLIELYDADNEKEHRIESIYGTTGSLSLVFTRKVAPQVKIPVLSVENPLRRIYRLNPEASVVVLEQASEVDLSTRLPAQFLRLCYAELNLIFEKWRTRYNSDRLKNLHFQSDHEALGYGYDVYRIGVLKARSLPRYDRKEHQTSSSSVLNRFRARAGKLVDAANRSSGGVCNPMVTLSFNDALVGKTNTEYDTTEPIFGENANVNACGHSKPFVKFHSSTETHSKVESTKDSTKEFVFYQPTIEDSNLNGMIRLDVANETFSMLNGLEHIPMGSILIDLSTLSGACVKDEHGLSATEWFPIENGLGEVLISLKIQFSTRSSPGELEIETKIQDSPISLIALDGGTTLDAVDYPYDKLDLSFVYRHVSQMKKQVEYIASLIELADRLTAEKKSFKSSQHKKREDVQGIPTNLHTGLFCVYKDLEPVASFACVTCGAPTAHALGLQEFGLRELEAEICRYHKILGIMLAEDSKTPSAALLSPRNPFIAEDSIEARFSEISIPGQIDTQMFSPSTVKKNKIKPPTLPRTVSDQKLTPIQVLERIEDLESKHHLRKTVVMSQCLSTLVTSFLSHIQVCSAETLKQFAAIGLLVGWESLISSQGKELFMLSDAWVAIRSLRHYVFQFITATTEETTEIELVKTAEKCILHYSINQFL